MQVLIEEYEKRHYPSVWDGRPGRLPSFQVGETQPLSVGVMRRIQLPWDSRIFTPIDVEDWTIQAAIGGTFVLPVAGSFPLTYDDELTRSIGYNPDATEIADALNALETVTALGGVSVQGSEGFFQITFTEAGVRELLTGNAAELSPLSILDIQRVVTGDVDTQEVQTLRITQNVASLATLSTDSADAAASFVTVQAGDATHNHKVRVTLPENRYGGTWTYTSASVESQPIGYDDSEEEIKTILEAISGVGTGNVSVERETEHEYLITYIGARALTLIAGIAVSGANLRVITTKSGTLDLRTAGIEALLNGAQARVVSLEIEGTPASGTPQKLLKQDVLLTRPVIERASVAIPDSTSFVQDVPFDLLTSGIAGALDSLATTNLATGQWIAKVVRDISGTWSASEWLLIAGTNAENEAAGYVRPDDYNASTNAKVWVRVSGF